LATVATGSGCAVVVRAASPHGWGIDPVVDAFVASSGSLKSAYCAADPMMHNRSEPIS
jgi:hypothetical protein